MCKRRQKNGCWSQKQKYVYKKHQYLCYYCNSLAILGKVLYRMGMFPDTREILLTTNEGEPILFRLGTADHIIEMSEQCPRKWCHMTLDSFFETLKECHKKNPFIVKDSGFICDVKCGLCSLISVHNYLNPNNKLLWNTSYAVAGMRIGLPEHIISSIVCANDCPETSPEIMEIRNKLLEAISND